MPSPSFQVAVRLNSRAGGKKLKSGDTVEYIICEDGTGLPATQRAYHADELAERTELKVKHKQAIHRPFVDVLFPG